MRSVLLIAFQNRSPNTYSSAPARIAARHTKQSCRCFSTFSYLTGNPQVSQFILRSPHNRNRNDNANMLGRQFVTHLLTVECIGLAAHITNVPVPCLIINSEDWHIKSLTVMSCSCDAILCYLVRPRQQARVYSPLCGSYREQYGVPTYWIVTSITKGGSRARIAPRPAPVEATRPRPTHARSPCPPSSPLRPRCWSRGRWRRNGAQSARLRPRSRSDRDPRNP